MAKPLEAYLFRNYSIAIKKFLIESLYLSRYPDDENVSVSYMIPAKAFSKIVLPVINGQPLRPATAFHLSGNTYSANENHLGFVKENIYISESNVVKQVEPPQIRSLTYSLLLFTTLQSDMDILLYQLLIAAAPNKKGYRIVDGQWMEIKAGDPRDETTLEPGDAQDKLIRYGIDLTVPRAYLPRTYKEVPSAESVQIIEYDANWDGEI